MPTGSPVEQASVYLRMLLARPGEYRTMWERTPSAEIDYTAVARVLAQPGARHPAYEATDPNGPAATQLTQLTRVARHALEGASLSPETLERFVQAFALRPPHARRLSALMNGASTVRAISGDLLPPVGMTRTELRLRHETLSLHESHLLGADGRPAEHQTIQMIRSKVDGLDSLPYVFDTDEIVVEVQRGGSIAEGVHRVTDTLYAVNILLAKPLPRGHTTLLRYHSTFFYRSQPPPELRRGVLARVQDLTMWVRFHPDRVPPRIWVARWDAFDQGRVVEQEPVELDDELSARCRFGAVERAVVGFYWSWD